MGEKRVTTIGVNVEYNPEDQIRVAALGIMVEYIPGPGEPPGTDRFGPILQMMG